MSKTPKEWISNINNEIITSDMLANCLYSVNKRAKNCRDKEREYRHNRYDNYNNEEKYREKKLNYYDLKELMLSIINPTCIHCEEFTTPIRERIYDYEYEYEDASASDNVVWRNSYYDKEEDRVVEFVDIITGEKTEKKYYLFYEVSGFSFHTPIEEDSLNKYKLEIVEIDNLNTTGKDITELVSTQFCNKLTRLIKDKTYKLIME